MQKISYRLGQYQIIVDYNGSISWQAHGGFGSVKGGRCFINGDILFIGPTEENETGYLKNEFLENLSKFPKWDRTKYYCHSYTIHMCDSGQVFNILRYDTISADITHEALEIPKSKSLNMKKWDLHKQINVIKKGSDAVAKGFQFLKSSFKNIKFKK